MATDAYGKWWEIALEPVPTACAPPAPGYRVQHVHTPGFATMQEAVQHALSSKRTPCSNTHLAYRWHVWQLGPNPDPLDPANYCYRYHSFVLPAIPAHY